MIVARVDNLKFFPGRSPRPALNGVSLTVRAGEIILIEGASGSGKSTLLRALAGLVPHFHGGVFHGSVEVCGMDTRRTAPALIAREVGCVFQDPETQAVRSSVAADVAFGPENMAVPAREIPLRVDEALRRAHAAHLADREVSTLSGGERQRAAIASVLAARPRILLLDEPTSQLDAEGVRALDRIVRSLSAEGVAIVVAEHHAHRLELMADRIVTLDAGRLVATHDREQAAPPTCGPLGATLLEVADLAAGYDQPVLHDCSLTLRAGTVTALHGANGSGKSTLLRVIAGLHPPTDGTIILAGAPMTEVPVHERVPTLGLLPQDGGRRLLCERVRDELGAALHGLGGVERARRVDLVLRELDLTALADAHPMDLSVGERERVALGAVLTTEPRVILLDEPTRGMDPVRRDQLAALLRRRAAEGACVLLATHDPNFALSVADRHLRLDGGCIVEDREMVSA